MKKSLRLFQLLQISLLVVVWTNCCDAANILGIIPTPSYSHQVAYQQLWRELSLRGHKVTVITTNPLKDPNLTNLTEIDMSFLYETLETKFQAREAITHLQKSPTKLLKLMYDIQIYVLNEELAHPEVQKLIKKDVDDDFDVVLAEFIYPAMYAFAEVYKCPLVAISSMDLMSTSYDPVGNPVHPVTHPNSLTLPMIHPLSFKERVISTLFNVIFSYYTNYITLPKYDLVVKKYFGDNFTSVSELKTKPCVTFINVDYVFHTVKPLIPNIIPVGGGSHLQSTQTLPKDLQNFMDDATNGVIFFSLGTNARSDSIGANMLKEIFEVLGELPYKAIIKVDTNTTEKYSKNLFVSSWLPQQAILGSGKIKLFITQGGSQSLDEAIYNHIPILGIPIYGDQFSNILRAVSKGIGLSLDRKTLSKESFRSAVVELLSNAKYRNRVKELADLSRDQPMTGLERAVWWTEYVIRHKGADHLRSPFIDLPAYQYYQLDVIGFCLFVVLSSTYIFVKIVQLVYRKSISSVKSKTE